MFCNNRLQRYAGSRTRKYPRGRTGIGKFTHSMGKLVSGRGQGDTRQSAKIPDLQDFASTNRRKIPTDHERCGVYPGLSARTRAHTLPPNVAGETDRRVRTLHYSLSI